MTLSQWFESTFSSDKFIPEKALKHTLKENTELSTEPYFIETFLELAQSEITKTGRLLFIDDIYRITQRARTMSRHQKRIEHIPKFESKEIQITDTQTYSTIPLNTELHSRLLKQLQNVKYTIDTFSEDHGHHIRTLKLRTAQETIMKIIEDMSLEIQSKKINLEMERTLRTEINRWTNFAETINKRLYRKISFIDFKNYVIELEKNFQKSKKVY